MRSARKVWIAGALAVLAASNGGHAQIVAQTGPEMTEDALYAMAQQAAVIFTGQVVTVRRLGGIDGTTGVVEIDFAVDDTVLGVVGSTYTLREWAGLWAAGDQPLRVGQHYLMLLHAPSATGLSSPVGGMDGAIPIRGGSEPALAEPGRGTPDGRMVDLRWVATRVIRPISDGANSVAHPTALPVPVRAEVVSVVPAHGTEASDGSPDSGAPALPVAAVMAPAAQDAGYATVLALLRRWEKGDDAAR